jgi:hypothetical protein
LPCPASYGRLAVLIQELNLNLEALYIDHASELAAASPPSGSSPEVSRWPTCMVLCRQREFPEQPPLRPRRATP